MSLISSFNVKSSNSLLTIQQTFLRLSRTGINNPEFLLIFLFSFILRNVGFGNLSQVKVDFFEIISLLRSVRRHSG